MRPGITLIALGLVGLGLLGWVWGYDRPSPRGRSGSAKVRQVAAPRRSAPQDLPRAEPRAGQAADRPKLAPQTRSHGQKVAVPLESLVVDDGDTFDIRWSETDVETVRILGIDTPETRHLEHNIPYEQSMGAEARAFAKGAFAAATQVELLRASMLDPYGRTLGYVYLNGKNYSLIAIREHFAVESVTPFGDNGFPDEAAAVLAAAREAGPVAFEPPYLFRGQMRTLTNAMKANGSYPRN